MNSDIHFFHKRWPVFYEDNHLLAIYKPAGLIMQRDHKDKVNLLDLAKLWIKTRYNKPGQAYAGMVHRLDGPVAGVVVVARTSKGASRLSAQIRQGTVEKQYLAVVSGKPPQKEDRLCHHLARKGRLSTIVPATTDSKAASLRYRLVAAHDQHSLVAVKLETGRRHQIRVQLAAVGCPIVGDVRYGASRGLAHGRIALLAHKLGFDHPTRGHRIQLESPPPQGWPWPSTKVDKRAPFWAIEDYYKNGLAFDET